MTDPDAGGLRRSMRPPGAEASADTIDDAGRSPALAATAEIYRRHAGFVWRVVRRMGIPDAAAEDVMHEVFMVVHRRHAEYDGRASLTTWLYHLARGVTSNWKRGTARAERRVAALAPPHAHGDPHDATERSEAAAFVRGFLAELDPDKREVFELVEIDGLGVPEVAELVGINLNTTYSRLRAARAAFQRAVTRLRAPTGAA